MNNWVNLSALWKILVIGLLAGAGLPALFAVGLRALNTGPRTAVVTGPHSAGSHSMGVATTDERVIGGSPIGISIAIVCFAAVLAAIGWGIYSIVSGS